MPVRRAIAQREVLPLDEAELAQAIREHAGEARVVGAAVSKISDRIRRPMLRTAPRRPKGWREAKECDELPSSHSFTSSARARSVGGIVRSRALAVLRLIARSNFVGAWMGSSPGSAPRKIRSM